ncbi:hypothetical protein HPC49_29285 [Pyxidicoccus fallax]|uniref:Big-1 domain-containing protein n=1 Tax=Pyxidicoccus fallax TaxID=394095 RepID=A0A848LTE0_9BACT|nr:hypothetical protein [Pyxidicoccus fallax]NMO21205.1 hypothetical protein [Pyxidicoccus fallax]NPC82300.1 hypothetical protein [Pyxidicoccus fallax]
MNPAGARWLGVLMLGGLCACETPTLGTGDTLRLSFQSERLYPQPAPETPPGEAAACTAAGGAVVDVRAWGSDGSIPDDAAVTLWLDPAGSASLHGFGTSCEAQRPFSGICVKLNEDGAAQACVLPGEETGQVGVYAHSGTVETNKTLTISGRVLTTGSTLTLSVAPGSSSVATPAQGSECGTPAPAPCFPGQLRKARVQVFAALPSGGAPVPDGTLVYLSATAGWLARPGQCLEAYQDAASALSFVALEDGAASLEWCFGDIGATATLTATSGPVTQTSQLVVPPVPASVQLIPSLSEVAAGGTVAFTATLLGCDGQGISGAPIIFSARQGQAEFASSAPAETSKYGVATVSGTLQTPAVIVATVAQAPNLTCSATVGVRP